MKNTKFRVWDKELKCWTYDFVLDQMGEFHQVNKVSGELAIGYSYDKNRYVFSFSADLNDRDNIEIYEGDIIVDMVNDRREVVFEDGGFWCKYPNGDRYMPIQEKRKVVGNIYENPELLNLR